METYQTRALGFPIIVINPKFKVRAGEKTLDINFKALSEKVFKAVIMKPARLTGGEIKFIRGFLGLNQSEFANIMGLKGHSQVSKWEKRPNEMTMMSSHQDFIIRLQATKLSKILKVTSKLTDLFNVIKDADSSGESIEIDAKEVA
jgi:DNA-binding transcriptional regulator YiaG